VKTLEAHGIGRSLAAALFLAFEVRGESVVAETQCGVTVIEGLDDSVVPTASAAPKRVSTASLTGTGEISIFDIRLT